MGVFRPGLAQPLKKVSHISRTRGREVGNLAQGKAFSNSLR